jgi:hypothetical protein
VVIRPPLNFLLELHQSLAHQGLAKSLDISIGMPALFTNLAASRSWHISSQKIVRFRLDQRVKNARIPCRKAQTNKIIPVFL